jgi:isopentenyl diphosphate isomerase/L-lactate dehydrogenase-like FMN-dependent dehydrogenase
VSRLTNVDDARRRAKHRLPRLVFDFIDGGAEDEVTLRANRRAFEDVAFRPCCIRDGGQVDTSTSIFGTHITSPVLIAPTGSARLVHPQAEVIAARAAARVGSLMVLSTVSNAPLEAVMDAASGPKWFQLYVHPDREFTRSLVERVRRAGYSALVCTVDTAVIGRRERDVRNGLTVPLKLGPLALLDLARHPLWVGRWVGGGRFSLGNLHQPGRRWWHSRASDFSEIMRGPGVTPDVLSWLRELWPGPLLAKGILTVEDAKEAVRCGVDGIIVSNHGGRQLDGAPAAIHALPEVVSAVGNQTVVLLDSGVRRGTDIAKALCLGARAVLIGRPWLWGAAIGGEEGIIQVLELLQHELTTALRLLGKDSVKELNDACLQPMDPTAAIWWMKMRSASQVASRGPGEMSRA